MRMIACSDMIVHDIQQRLHQPEGYIRHLNRMEVQRCLKMFELVCTYIIQPIVVYSVQWIIGFGENTDWVACSLSSDPLPVRLNG